MARSELLGYTPTSEVCWQGARARKSPHKAGFIWRKPISLE